MAKHKVKRKRKKIKINNLPRQILNKKKKNKFKNQQIFLQKNYGFHE